MVINEKALVAQMKEAYKNGGYRVLVSDSRMVFSNGYWLARSCGRACQVMTST